MGGGTGSGFGARIEEELSVEYSYKKQKMAFKIFNSPRLSTSVVEPYNAILASRTMLEYNDITLAFDNQSLY